MEAERKAAAVAAKKESDRKAAAARVAAANRAAERKAAAEKLAASRSRSGSGGSKSPPRAIRVGGGGGSSASADTGWYDQLIKKTFENNWREPKNTTGQDIFAKVMITVAPDGRVIESRFVKQSNVRTMDDSVVAALRATKRIPRALPGDLAGSNYTIKFTFKLTP